MRTLAALVLMFSSTAALADKSCKEQVDDAFKKLREAKSFRLETTIRNAQGQLKMQSDYVLPDRMHQRVTMEGSAGPMEMIVIGKKAWSNQGQGWAEVPQNFAEAVAKQVQETVAESPKTMTDYKCLGDKDFEGKKYAVYQGILPTPLPPDAEKKGPRLEAAAVPNQQNVYIDKATGLPIRNIVNAVTEPDKRLFDGTFTIVEGLKVEAPEIKSN